MAAQPVHLAFLFMIAVKSELVKHPALPSDDWVPQNDIVPGNYTFKLRISVKQSNLDGLFRLARDVSNPKSESYGKYLSAAAIEQMTPPSQDDVAVVKDWLHHAGLDGRLINSHVIETQLTAKDAATLLQTQFSYHTSKFTKESVVRAGDYFVPSSVDQAISAIYGLHGFPLPPRESLMPQESTQPAKVTPDVIASTYTVSGVTPSGSTKNRQAVAEFQGQTMKPSDLTKFFSDYVKSAPSSADTIYKFVPSGGTGSAGVEASLDVDYIMGVAPGLLTEFWYWGGNDFCSDLEQWTAQILSSDDTPLVHSVSYGWQGKLSSVGCSDSKVKDVDANFAKIAAKGITIIFASGDSGSGYTKPFFGKGTLYPSWPASSPWVTAVGSTRFQSQKVGQAEMATDQFGSGGGFSTMFDAFQDQVSAVKTYLSSASGLPPATMFPAGGRATPDVSALGEGFQVVASGRVESVGGTSAAAPTFAGLVSLLNEARLKAGKPAMGYLNPFLYQNPDAFTDITVGSDKIGRGGGSLAYGYECAKGWDPVTGLGTPIFGKLKSAALASVGVQAEEPLLVV